MSSLSVWLDFLETLDNKIVLDLGKLKYFAKKLDILNLKSFVFTVGGTNGKGTTCVILEKLLLNSGYTVGLYTSPHLINYSERIRINGLYLNEQEHVASFYKIKYIIKNLTQLNYFEFITLSALILFKRFSLDIIILEVGLGGRLDATNIIDSNLSIITNIGLDHTHILGKNRFDIAREKSGIFRKDKIAIIGEKNIPDSINKIAIKKNAILKKNNKDWWYEKINNHWNFIHPNIQLYNLPITQIPRSNTGSALAALYYSNLKINKKIIKTTISSVRLPGRFQIIAKCPYVIIDVAHNPDASLYLSKKIKKMNITGMLYAIIGVLKDKDILGIMQTLNDQVHYWYTAPLQSLRTATIEQLENIFPANKTYIFNSINEAYHTARMNVKNNDVILIFGSFLTVSEFIISNNILIK